MYFENDNINLKRIGPFIKRYFLFLLSFIFTKGTVYFIPLLLADLLTTTEFGILEYALAGLGFVVNGLINLGVPNGYPYFILRLKEIKIKNGFILHPIWLLILFLVNVFAYYILNLQLSLFLAFNVSYIIANQVFYSTQLKSHEKPIKAIFIDSGVYIVLLVTILLFKTKVIFLSIENINKSLLLYASIYGLIAIYNFYKIEKKQILYHYKKILKYSHNIMIGTFLIILITASGRILAEYFFGYDEVAIYGFYFRLAAIVVMIHQMANILFFKKIYTLDPQTLDKYYHLFFMGIFSLSLVMYYISPIILGDISTFFNESYDTYKAVYFLLSAQMVMWIASALNSNVIDRENLAKNNNLKFVALIVVVTLILFIVKENLSFQMLVFIHYTGIFMACLIQYLSLAKRKIYFKRSILTLSLSYLITTVFYFTLF